MLYLKCLGACIDIKVTVRLLKFLNPMLVCNPGDRKLFFKIKKSGGESFLKLQQR